MFEPCIVKKDLQYSCDLCGELPILGRRWCCDVCEDFDVCESCRERGLQMGERGQSHPGPHQPGHAMKPFEPTETHAPVHRGKLRDVAEDAVQRWFCDALRCAKNGDPNQAALVSEMLKSGYGCNKDADEARYWKQVARNAGARRIEGVYDELP